MGGSLAGGQRDREELFAAFLENGGKKRGGPKTLAMLAMLAMLLFDRTQPA
jgi:hypothetical protein